ncbi:CoA-acylating methylmalonate-semialdehyde dehydrogenase [Fodinicurvata fenggangensis]|uniref:CoA-acylating methylmalonate-semialdehyde dehydrogenase n=1 Tax=Fodinicurvata fenggangensis TaxID=1121830 RepID=UPI000478E5DA|nr:CoA-acylating methylmalonate-semialdehyde dehydrogenase [Fodinicurvata fenggangensis]
MTQELHHFIGGQVVKGTSGRTSDVYNPATGEVTGKLSLASAAEVDNAVQNAAEAFQDWAATTPLNRARVFFKYRELLEANKQKIAELISREHGKVLADAAGEVTRGIEVVEFVCGAPHLLKGEFSENVGTNVDSHSVRQPLGVVAGITPFNFPAMVPMWMFPVAIACGNTFILKPSERDPSAPLFLAELAKQAGLPDGVLNVVNGDKEAVDTLLTHPQIEAVSFVGSTGIAEYVYHTGTAHNKRVQALGGAKNHMVVMPDADMDQAANALMGAGYGSAGERCMAVSVAVAVGSAGDELIERLAPKVRNLKVGPFDDPEADMGPLVTKEAYERVRGYIDSGIEEGAEAVVDGRELKLQGYENGYFVGGTLFDKVKPDMRIYKEEIFGPVLSVVRANDYEEALKLVNDHEYGNGAAIFTHDGDAARNFSNRAQIGMIGVNVPIPVPMAFFSFGGWKRSLFGDHHAHGPEGVRFYTRMKTITSRWPKGVRSGAEFVMPTMK